MADGVTRLFCTEVVDQVWAYDPQVFRALVWILDDAPAEAGSGPLTGWDNIGERLDEWIRFCGLSPEAIRAEARA